MKIVIVLLLTAALARQHNHPLKAEKEHSLKGHLQSRLKKKRCDSDLEELKKEISAVNSHQNSAQAVLTEVQNALPTIKSELTTKMEELEKRLQDKINILDAKVGEGCSKCKEDTAKMVEDLKTQVMTNKQDISIINDPFAVDMPENIMPNAKVLAMYNLQGEKQDKESFKYQKAIKPESKKNDPTVYVGEEGGNGGWNSIGTRLKPDVQTGVGIIDLQDNYMIKKFVIFGFDAFTNDVEIFQWNKDTTPDFDQMATITTASNWKSVGRNQNMVNTNSYQTKYKTPHEMNVRFKGRYIKTQVIADNIQVITGLKGYGVKV